MQVAAAVAERAQCLLVLKLQGEGSAQLSSAVEKMGLAVAYAPHRTTAANRPKILGSCSRHTALISCFMRMWTASGTFAYVEGSTTACTFCYILRPSCLNPAICLGNVGFISQPVSQLVECHCCSSQQQNLKRHCSSLGCLLLVYRVTCHNRLTLFELAKAFKHAHVFFLTHMDIFSFMY